MDIYLDMFMSEMESPITCNLDVLSNHYLNFLKKLIECCNKYGYYVSFVDLSEHHSTNQVKLILNRECRQTINFNTMDMVYDIN